MMHGLRLLTLLAMLFVFATLTHAQPMLIVRGEINYASGETASGTYAVQVINETRQLSATVQSTSGDYTVTFLDLSTDGSVAEVGDTLRASVLDAAGDILTSHTYQLEATDLSAAVVSIPLVLPDPSPPPPPPQTRPVLVMSGQLLDASGHAVSGEYTIRAVNETRGVEARANASNAQYSLALLALNADEVAAKPGDTIHVSAVNARGELCASSAYRLQDVDISTGVVTLDLEITLLAIPLFTVYGVVRYEPDRPVADGWQVHIANETRGIAAITQTNEHGKYALTLANTDGVVFAAGIGDILVFTLRNPSGDEVGSQLYHLTDKDIRTANTIVHLNPEWLGTLQRLFTDEPLPDQQLRWKGDEHRYQLEVRSEGPLIIQVRASQGWVGTLRVKPDTLPDQPENYWEVSGKGQLEIFRIWVSPGIYTVHVISDSEGTEYEILATRDIRQAQTTFSLENETVQAQFSVARGCFTSLIFRPGSNQELIDSSQGRFLFDLGSQDPRLATYFQQGWHIEGMDLQAASLVLALQHASGFSNELKLVWQPDRVEANAEFTAPEAIEINQNLSPGQGFQAGADSWAVPTPEGVQTGSFSYPDTSAWLYPSNSPDEWAIPSEGWLAFWNDSLDEVHGFTFSGGYQLQVANGSATDLHFRIPAGTSRISFHVVRPKATVPYESIRAQATGPFMTLVPQVDKRFVGAGAELNYRLDYTNTGGDQANGVVVETVLPSELELTSGSLSPGGIYDPASRRISWGVSDVPGGPSSQAVTFTAIVVQGVPEGAEIAPAVRIWSVDQPVTASPSAMTLVHAPIINSITPDKGGNTGTVTVTIRGEYLDMNAEVALTLGGQEPIHAVAVSGSTDGLDLTVVFDLAGEAQEDYDLAVRNPGRTWVTMPSGFTIESGGVAELWVDIVGRDTVRAGRETPYQIVYRNPRNNDATGIWIPVWIPLGFGYRIMFGDTRVAEGAPNQPLSDSWQILTVFIDRLPAMSEGYFDLVIAPPGGSQSGQVGAAITRDFGSLFPEHVCWAPLDEFSGNNPIRSLIRQERLDVNVTPLHRSDHSGDIIFVHARGPEYEGQHVLVDLGDGRVGHNFFGGPQVIPNASPFPSEITLGDYTLTHDRTLPAPPDVNRAEIISNWENFSKNYQEQGWKYKPWPTDAEYAEGYRSCLTAVLAAWGYPASLKTADIDGDGGLNTAEVRSYLESQTSDPPQRWLTQDRWTTKDIFEWITTLLIQIITSIDPNDKVTSTGISQQQYIAGARPIPYKLLYENLPAATAYAQDILITDRLDTNLDWSTFALDAIQIGTRTVTVPSNTQDFTTTVDLRPTLSTLVDVECELNQTTGVFTCLLRGRNPYTGGLEDFLPPNTTEVAPLGEGHVSYTVMPKSGLATGTVIRNKAIIDFEVDVPPEPMETPEVFHTIDADAPTSQVAELPATQASASFTVEWSGDDVGAGVRDFTIFVSEGDGPYSTWLSHTTETSSLFTGVAGKFYRFYSRARDHVGNIENVTDITPVMTEILDQTAEPPWDVNGDDSVDILDLTAVGLHFGATIEGDPTPNPDINRDGLVDIGDLVLIGLHFGETISGAVPAAPPSSNGPPVAVRLTARRQGNQLHVAISAEDAVDLAGFQFDLDYDAGKLSLLTVKQGSVLRNYGESYWREPQIHRGYVRGAAATRLSSGGKPSDYGVRSGTLGELVFTIHDEHQFLSSQLRLSRIKLVDTSGRRLSVTVERQSVRLEELLVPEHSRLMPNYPNPFNPDTWIPYQVAKLADVRLQIFSSTGHVVRTLALGTRPAGYYIDRTRAAYWDGRNNSGDTVASGIYWVAFHAGDFTQIRRLLLRK